MSTGGRCTEIPDAIIDSNVTVSPGSDRECLEFLAAKFPLTSCPRCLLSVLKGGVCDPNCTAVPDANKLSSPTDWKNDRICYWHLMTAQTEEISRTYICCGPQFFSFWTKEAFAAGKIDPSRSLGSQSGRLNTKKTLLTGEHWHKTNSKITIQYTIRKKKLAFSR